MASHEATVSEAHELSHLLVVSADLAKDDFADIAARHGVPVALARALVQLTEPIPMSELARRLDCDRSYITGVAKKLEESGLITRPAGQDQRIKLLTPTESGRRIRTGLVQELATASLITRKLTPEQRAALRPLLQALAADRIPLD